MDWGTDQTSRVHWEGQTLTVIQPRVRPAADDSWEFTDTAGHTHVYGTEGDRYPSLARISDGWADPPEDGEDDDTEFERYRLACVQCGEVIWPSPAGPGMEILPGVFFYWIDDVNVTQLAARSFTNRIRVADPDRWERLYGWLKYSAGLIPNTLRAGRA